MEKAKLMMINTFYNHLLFNPSSAVETGIRLLILGSDKYASAALKQGFSCGQVAGRVLHIAMAVPPKKKMQKVIDDLLKEMPAFERFARIGSDWYDDDDFTDKFADKYGDLAFVQSSFSDEDVKKLVSSFSPNYIVCSSGKDDENIRIASAAVSAAGTAFVGYVCSKKGNASADERIFPIFPVRKVDEIDQGLRRMAYNTHLCYSKNHSERTPIKDIFEQFHKDEYSNGSSYAFALHIKYKLASLGIDMDDCYKAAEAFKKKIEMNDRKALCKLAYYEHRRWCAYSAAEGMQPPPDDDISYISDECDFKKITISPETGAAVCYHPALVPSTLTDIVLESVNWNGADLSRLDPLDRVSVRINRELKRNINKYDQEIMELRKRIIDSSNSMTHELIAEFDKNVELIITGNRRVAMNYPAICSSVKEKLGKLYPENDSKLKSLIEKIEQLSKKLFVRIEYLKKYDYKAVDFEMIRSIPFILQYRSDLILIQKLRPEYTHSRLQAVKAAIDLEPKELVLVGTIKYDSVYEIPAPKAQIAREIERFEAILKYRQEREFCEHIKLALVMPVADSRATMQDYEELCAHIRELCLQKKISPDLIELYYVNETNSWEDVVTRIKGDCITPVNENCNVVNGMPEDSAVYSILSSMGIRDLRSYRSCLIPKSFTVREHMMLHSAEVTSFNSFALSNCYKLLWGLCHYNTSYDLSLYKKAMTPENVWNSELCNLAKIIKDMDYETLANIPKPIDADNYEEHKIRVPNPLVERIVNMLRSLSESGVVRNVNLGYNYSAAGDLFRDSKLIKYECSSEDIGSIDDKGVKNSNFIHCLIDELITNIIKKEVTVSDIIECRSLANKHCIEVRLSKNYFDIKKPESKYCNANLQAILDKLVEAKLLEKTIIPGEADGEKTERYNMSFSELKDVLTNAGTLLEAFIFFAMKNSGYFSDVISNMKISWRGRGIDHSSEKRRLINNELDVAATKGSVTMLVSAKNREFKDKDKDNVLMAMYEINSLGMQFDAIPVLVSGIPNTVAEGYADRAENMKKMHLIRREDYALTEEQLKGKTGSSITAYEEIAALEEKKLSELLIGIINEYTR